MRVFPCPWDWPRASLPGWPQRRLGPISRSCASRTTPSRPDEISRDQGTKSKKKWYGPAKQCHAAGALAKVLVGLEGHVVGTMRGQGHQRHPANEHRVPIEDARVRAEFEVGPERLKEIAGCIQRNSAHYVAERRPKKHRQKNAGDAEGRVKEVLPHRVFDVSAEFDANAAQNEQPQNHH